MEAKGSSGQSCVYNTYAPPSTTNHLFSGFSSYQSVNKEIGLSANRSIQKKSASFDMYPLYWTNQ